MAYRKSYEDSTKGKRRALNGHLKRNYGITIEEFELLLEKQQGRCAICGTLDPQAKSTGRFFVDHDHTTGKVRGLLCFPCNSGLGLLKDSKDLLRKAICYLVES